MNNSGPTLPRERMEEMLTDYALGGLPEADIPLFEQSLSLYPDIQEDIRRIREAFAQFDKEDFIERQTRPARTLSVHVQQQLAGRQSLLGSRSLRHAIPAFGIALLALFMFAPGGFFNRPDVLVPVAAVAPAAESSLISSAVTLQNVAQMVEDSRVLDPLAVAFNMPDQTPMSDVDFSNNLDIAIGDELAISDEMAQGLADNELFPMSDYSLGGGLYDGMQESEIQQLLEELDNAIL